MAFVKYVKLDFIVEATQARRTKFFIYFSDHAFTKFCINNGLVVMNTTEITSTDYQNANKDRKQSVVMGNEALQ